MENSLIEHTMHVIACVCRRRRRLLGTDTFPAELVVVTINDVRANVFQLVIIKHRDISDPSSSFGPKHLAALVEVGAMNKLLFWTIPNHGWQHNDTATDSVWGLIVK